MATVATSSNNEESDRVRSETEEIISSMLLEMLRPLELPPLDAKTPLDRRIRRGLQGDQIVTEEVKARLRSAVGRAIASPVPVLTAYRPSESGVELLNQLQRNGPCSFDWLVRSLILGASFTKSIKDMGDYAYHLYALPVMSPANGRIIRSFAQAKRFRSPPVATVASILSCDTVRNNLLDIDIHELVFMHQPIYHSYTPYLFRVVFNPTGYAVSLKEAEFTHNPDHTVGFVFAGPRVTRIEDKNA